jgi:TolB protein
MNERKAHGPAARATSCVMQRIALAAACALAMGLAGCSLFSQSSRTTAPVAEAPPAPPAAWANGPEQSYPVSQSVNIFGEINGVQRRVVLSGAEAGLQQHSSSDEGFDADITVDPTGKWMAFASTRHSEHPDIYLQRIDGSSVIQLTNDPADDAQPTFSPDGKRIAFASTRAGNWDIYVMDLDGKNVEQITNSVAQEMHPSFSPDGTRLVYCALSPRTDQWELWVVDLAGHERKMIGQGLFPAWCPAKGVDRIAFQRARQRGSHWFSLWTVDLVDGEPRRLTEVAVSSSAAVVAPTWSPDGSRLAFATILSPATPAENKPKNTDVWTVNADGSGKQRLTDSSGVNLSPFWASNNRIFFISDRGGAENIWSVKAETGGTMTASSNSAPPAKAPAKPAAVGSVDTHEIGH